MQKSAPSIGRILVAVGFTLSCFALLLFLWVTFGGPVPFKPESYRFTADFPEAITLAKEADVRIGGVSVGKVKDLSLAPDSECQKDPTTCNTTRATIEIDPQYAPISSDARAILRSKTLLGETYVELTSGSQVQPGQQDNTNATAQANTIDVGQISGGDAPQPIPEGGHLAQTQVQNQTQIDEIFQGFDQQTREAFQSWMQNSALAVNGRGLDLNDAFGNLGPFASDASDVLGTLRRQEESLRTLVHDTGDVFAALTDHDQALAGAVVGANRTFGALASQSRALSDTFKILPTFENESRLTLDRLKPFAEDARPVFHDLRPVARDLSPTLHDVRRLAPYARKLFKNFDPLIKASSTGLPSLRNFVHELRPVMDGLDPFLANFNPILRWLDYQAPVVGDFLSNPSSSTADFLPAQAGQNAAAPSFAPDDDLHCRVGVDLPESPGDQSRQRVPAALRDRQLLPDHPGARSSRAMTAATRLRRPVTAVGTASDPPPVEPAAGGERPVPVLSSVASIRPTRIRSAPTPRRHPARPGPSAYAACTVAPNFPSLFGGGVVPTVNRDP